MFCSSCGTQLSDVARFCTVCGTAVATPETSGAGAGSAPGRPATAPARIAPVSSSADARKTLENLTLGTGFALILVELLDILGGDWVAAMLTLGLAFGAGWAYQQIKTEKWEGARMTCLIVGALCAVSAAYDLFAGPTDAIAVLVAGGCASALLYTYTRLPLAT